jgi:hypothetical protein
VESDVTYRTTTARGHGALGANLPDWTRPPLAFDDGEPCIPDDVDRDRIELDGAPYMERYWLHRGRGFEVRLHHLLTDDARDLHDHPWDFVSLLLTGGYRETTVDGTVEHWAPIIVPRPARRLHRLELLAGPMWTYVVTGPISRTWGFATEHGWVNWRTYLERQAWAGAD